jgi:hypothetical protein
MPQGTLSLQDARPVDSITCDALVVGGGAAGVAAAVTAARQGLRVVLAERYGFCGGGAVAGLSGTVCGLYMASERPDARPEQVVFGFAQEFCRALEQRGGLGQPLRYGKTWTRVHEPLAWRETADALLTGAGVRVIYHAVAMGVLAEGGERLEGALVWTKQGPLEIRARLTIDASGDADIVAMAGMPDIIGADGMVQNPTMIFRMMGVDIPRFLEEYGEDTIMNETVSGMIREAQARGENLPRLKIWLFPTTRPGELLCNCTRISGAHGEEINTLRRDDFSLAEVQGRLQVRAYEDFFRRNLAGCEKAFVNDTGVQAGVRQTRQLRGVAMLSNKNVTDAQKFPDAIARSPWPIELHAGDKPKLQWILDDCYEIPYDCFVPQKGTGLLAAGRCLSAEHEAVASARVTAQCFSYGHAIGHAAALAVKERIEARDVDPQAIRLALNKEDARL